MSLTRQRFKDPDFILCPDQAGVAQHFLCYVDPENAEKYLARFDIDKETFEESLEEALADLVDEFFER